MPVIPPRRPDVLPQVTLAALLLAAVPHLRALGLCEVTGSQILSALGVTKSRAYLLKDRLEAFLMTLVGPVGRPSAPAPEPTPPSLATELLRYLAHHPGAVRHGASRKDYSDGYRRFVLELRDRHPDIALDAFAESTDIPLGTLEDWLRSVAAAAEPAAEPPSSPSPPKFAPVGPQLQTLLAEWDRWDGTFVAFCDHVQQHHRLPFRRAAIATILEAAGVRLAQRRSGRSPDETALRGAFVTYFPHAQWVGDGTLIPVEVDGERFAFNLELDVDAASGAFVGAHVSDVEDSEAVIAAFHDAIASTGRPPLALLLDNKPSNHTDDVTAALGDDTMLIAATPFRPQNKAHVEGGFGLLKPTLEGLALDATGTPRDLARSLLQCLVIAACRAIYHRPRRDRGGRSRASLLNDAPTNAQIEQARRDLRDLLERQRKARETLAARQDPVVRERIIDAIVRLALDDPRGNFVTAIARYPLDAVVDGIAIFDAKRRVQTLPDGADARYLLGIVRNVAHERESWALADALWAERTAARDALAVQLEHQREAIVAAVSEPTVRLTAFIDAALGAQSRIDRHFWLNAAATTITTPHDPTERRTLYDRATRALATAYAVDRKVRDAALRFLAGAIIPLA